MLQEKMQELINKLNQLANEISYNSEQPLPYTLDDMINIINNGSFGGGTIIASEPQQILKGGFFTVGTGSVSFNISDENISEYMLIQINDYPYLYSLDSEYKILKTFSMASGTGSGGYDADLYTWELKGRYDNNSHVIGLVVDPDSNNYSEEVTINSIKIINFSTSSDNVVNTNTLWNELMTTAFGSDNTKWPNIEVGDWEQLVVEIELKGEEQGNKNTEEEKQEYYDAGYGAGYDEGYTKGYDDGWDDGYLEATEPYPYSNGEQNETV